MSFPIRVDRPVFEPHRCAVLGKGDDQNGWIDCGNLASSRPDPRMYVSHGGVLTAARIFGYDIPALVARAEQASELEDELARERVKVANLEDRFNAIDVLASADFRARKRPGAKPKQKVEA